MIDELFQRQASYLREIDIASTVIYSERNLYLCIVEFYPHFSPWIHRLHSSLVRQSVLFWKCVNNEFVHRYSWPPPTQKRTIRIDSLTENFFAACYCLRVKSLDYQHSIVVRVANTLRPIWYAAHLVNSIFRSYVCQLNHKWHNCRKNRFLPNRAPLWGTFPVGFWTRFEGNSTRFQK